MGFRPVDECGQSDGPFDADRDLGFFTDPPQTLITVRPGQFAVFFPADAHAPMIGEGTMHKVIVKIAVDYPEGAPR